MNSGTVYFSNLPCGIIAETEKGYEFNYLAVYLNSTDAQPISQTLPLRPEPYFSKVLHPFFDNLIPEGWLLTIATEYLRLKSNNRMELLLSVCEDCIGAVSVKRNPPAAE